MNITEKSGYKPYHAASAGVVQVDNVPQVSAFLHAINKLLCEVVTKLSVITAASPAPVAGDVRLQGT